MWLLLLVPLVEYTPSMVRQFLLAVFATLLGAACADAGVIASRQAMAEPSDDAVMSVLVELSDSLDSESAPPRFVSGGSNDLAGSVLTSVSSPGGSAVVLLGLIAPLSPAMSWYIGVLTPLLPPSPVLDGLLKPA